MVEDYFSENEYKQGMYPVHDAASEGSCSSLLQLINEGQDVNLCNGRGETPVFLATVKGNDEALQLLLANGGNPDLCNEDKESPLLKAIKGTSVQERCVQILLDENADPDIGDSTKWYPLHEACYKGIPMLVEHLLMSKACLDVQTEDGVTPLYTAAQYGQSDSLSLLLQWGADPRIVTNEGDTPLHIACQEGHSDCAKLLLDYGSDVDHHDSTGRSPLAAACSKDEYDCVKLLIDNGADLKPYPFDSANNSPLHIAARQPGARCLGLLIDAEIDVNKMCDGVTPLFGAASVGSSFGCNLLLSKGADPNQECSEYDVLTYTPLMIAAQDNHVDTVAELVSGGADINYATFTSPLILAAKSGSYSSFNYLIDSNVDINYTDPGKNTALSTICGIICLSHVSRMDKELLGCCRNLLQSGADISRLFQRDIYSHLLDLPLIHSHPELIKLILEFDGDRHETREICELKICHNDWKPLYDIVKSPRSLEHLCRLLIRNTLGYKRLKAIDDLPIPDTLKNYLRHKAGSK